MWLRKSCLRPVPAFAKIPASAIEHVRGMLVDAGDEAHEALEEAFAEFEEEQPALAVHVGNLLNRNFSESSLALGYFCSLAVWLAFKQAHGRKLEVVSPEELTETTELVRLDEELRTMDPAEALDTDDVITLEQPVLLEFLHDHIETTLDLQTEIEPDELAVVYRTILVLVLVLSYAVRAPAGFPLSKAGILA